MVVNIVLGKVGVVSRLSSDIEEESVTSSHFHNFI